MTGARLRLMRGAALAVAGIGALLAAFGHSGRSAQIDGSDKPINTGARNGADISANNSPTLAEDPRDHSRLAVVNRIDSPRYSCALHVSGNGGASWSRVPVPIPGGEEHKCFAPDAVFAADGTFYMSYATLRGAGNVPHAIWLVSSRDGGRTLTRPRRVLGPLSFQVRLAADRRRPKRLYLSWVAASSVGLYRFSAPGNPIKVMRSDDGGATWRRGVAVNGPDRLRVVAPVPAVGPDGTVYVLYLDLRGDRLDYEGAHGGFGGPPYRGRFALVLARSRNAGASWQESVVDPAVVPTQRFISFLPQFPSLAVDQRDGTVYAGYSDARLGRADVYVRMLAPSGRWAAAVRVNDTPARDRTSQFLPALAVAPDGRLDVAYYDRRVDPGDRYAEVSLQSSSDRGRTFSPHLFLAGRTFDSHVGAGSERGMPDLGSRLGLVAEDGSALAVWADTRAGTLASDKQDLGSVRVKIGPAYWLPSPARFLLGAFGLVLLLLAGSAVLRGTLSRYHVPTDRGDNRPIRG
jgi:hypothetical protein